MRRKPTSPQEDKHLAVRRTRSSVEIQRYAEDEDDEDFSDIFGREESIMEKPESDSGSERGTLMLNSKLSNNSWVIIYLAPPPSEVSTKLCSLVTMRTMTTHLHSWSKALTRWVSMEAPKTYLHLLTLPRS